MQWSVIKTGAEHFDLLHAYGLGILLAHASGQPIEVRDTSATVTLISDETVPPVGSLTLLDEVLLLPTHEAIATARLSDTSLPLTNLDGLLTLLFSTPGGRVLSVADLLTKARHDTECIAHALGKVQHALAHWKTISANEAFFGAASWLERVLQDYQPRPSPFLPRPTAHETSPW